MWYDEIHKKSLNEVSETSKPAFRLRLNGKLAEAVSHIRTGVNYADGSFSYGSMAKFTFIGGAIGFVGGLLSKKNILLYTLAGTGGGTLIGIANEKIKEYKTENKNKEE